MKKISCEDCGATLEEWDSVFLWPEEFGQTVLLCENCMEARIVELRIREIAERFGVQECTAEELSQTF